MSDKIKAFKIVGNPISGMNPRVTAVTPNTNHTITLIFTNGEIRVFDVKPYLDKGIFQELKDLRYFNSVKPVLGSVQWKNGQDFCPDMLYIDSTPVADVNAEPRTGEQDLELELHA